MKWIAPALALAALCIGGGFAAYHQKLAPSPSRLIEALDRAIEVPLPPPERTLGSWDTLPEAGSGGAVGVPFTTEPHRPVMVRLLGRARTQEPPTIVVNSLTEAEAEAFGASPKAFVGPVPGEKAEPCHLLDRAPDGWSACQAFVPLPQGRTHGIVIIAGAEARRLRILDADVPDPRAPDNPVTARLVRRYPNQTATGTSWRSCLVARPGSRYVFDLVLPDEPKLWLGTGHEAGHEVPERFIVRENDAVLLDEVVASDEKWHDHALKLQGARGDEVKITLETQALDGVPGTARGLWADPRVLGKADKPNILLITVDALRPDHTSAYGYSRDTTPALERAVGLGVRFENATAQASRTWESVMSLLSGLYPIHDGARDRGVMPPPDVKLLPDLLSAEGYDTFAGNDLALFPGNYLSSFDEAELPPFPAPLGKRKRSPVTQFQHLVQRFADHPTFVWLHLENPHYPLIPIEPLRYDPGYEGRFKEEMSFDDHERYYHPGDVTPREMEHLIDLYDSSVRDGDDDLRKILTALNESGQWDHTIVVITADHGEKLGEHGAVIEHYDVYDAVLHVPLVIMWGDNLAAGHAVPQRVQLIDLVPTLFSLAGLPPPRTDGRDLSPALRGRDLPDAPAFAELMSEAFSMYRGSQHLLFNPTGLLLTHGRTRFLVRPRELYDLKTDPKEVHDLAEGDRARTDEAVGLLKAEIDRWGAQDARGSTVQVGQAALHALRQAGYLQDISAPVTARQ